MSDKQSRRLFLKSAGAVALAPVFYPFASPVREISTGSPAFSPPLGVCTSIGNADLLREVGFDYIEEGVRRLLIPDRSSEEFEANLAASRLCGLPVIAANGFLPGTLKSTGPEADHEGVLRFAGTAFRRARLVGIKVIVFGSSGSRNIPEDFDPGKAREQFIALLKRMGPLAAEEEVIVTIEPLQERESNFINTIPQGAAIVREVDHPNIQLLADIFHMLRMKESPDHIREAGRMIRHVHIAEEGDRTPPGMEGDDFQPFFQALKDVGYEGAISIECSWKDMSEQLPVALKTLRDQMARVK